MLASGVDTTVMLSEYQATILRVIDGDHRGRLRLRVYTQCRFRLLGINAPSCTPRT